MKPILTLLVTIFGCILINSCQKEFLNPDASKVPVDTTVIVPPHDSVTLLSKLILMKAQTGTDTAGLYEYLYDNLNRVTTINYYNHQTGVPAHETTIEYFYKGKDSIAFKRTKDETDLSYSETTYFFYNLDKTLAKDSLIFPNGKLINDFFYTSTAITDTGRIYYDSDPSTAIVYSAKGSLDAWSKVVRTVTMGDNYDHVENTFTYDDKPNPFAQLNISSTFNPVPGYDFYLYDDYFLKNNVTTSTQEEVIAQGPKVSTTYTYLYNYSGMPISVIMNSDYGMPDNVRILFEYKTI